MKRKTPMRELRDRVQLSPEQIAVVLGVRSASIYNWESGRSEPNLTPAQTLALLALYQCKLEDLVDAIAQTCPRKEVAA